jgi:formylglycine-generating enzyme required for sulfatase activity
MPHRLLTSLIIPLLYTTALAAAPACNIWTHQGDPFAGTPLLETLPIQTPYAQINLPIQAIQSIELAQPPDQIDRITTFQKDRISGFILLNTLQLQPPNGPQLTLHLANLTRIAFAPTNTTTTPTNHQLVFLRNGDTLHAQITGGPYRITTPQTDIQLTATNLASARFTPSYPTTAQILTFTGTTINGTWPPQDLSLQLDCSPTLSIHPAYIGSIEPPLEPASTNTQPPSGPGGDFDLVWIPPGNFTMGSPNEEPDRDLDEGPQTQVTLTHGFWISRCEITQTQYRSVMNINPSLFLGDPRRPVERVSYRDATDFCQRLTLLHTQQALIPPQYAYRLPTEAEWEYACRANTQTRFSHGNDPLAHDLEDYAWFNANSDSSTQPVGSRQPNPWGLHDLHGNVLEWCLDGASSQLPGNSITNPITPPEGILRIARGGSWLHGARACRSANRDAYSESTRSSDLGFRIALATNNQ